MMCRQSKKDLLGPGRLRRIYITKAAVARHGKTTKCPACTGDALVHTEACRKRMTGLEERRIERDNAATKRLAAAPVPAEQQGAVAVKHQKTIAAGPGVAAASASARLAPVPEDPESKEVGMETGSTEKRKRSESDVQGPEASSTGGNDDAAMDIFALAAEEEALFVEKRKDAVSALQDPEDREWLPLELGDGWQYRQPAALKPARVREAREEEKGRHREFGVYRRILASSWNGPVVDGRWVDEVRGGLDPDDEDAEYRSRVVARDYKSGRVDEDTETLLFAGTPDAHVFRSQLSYAAESRDHVMVLVDARSAYYQSPAQRDKDDNLPVMKPPADCEPPGILWVCDMAMPGMATASRSWQSHQSEVMEKEGDFDRCPQEPCLYKNDEHKCRTEVHGDDSLSVLTNNHHKCLCVFFTTNFVCTVKAIVGLFQDMVRQAQFLKRNIYVGEKGWAYEADPKHAKNLVDMHGLNREGAKGSPTPGAREVSKFDGAEEPMEKQDQPHFKSGAGIGQFLAGDRWDLKFSCKEVTRDAGNPTLASAAKLKRLARYLKDNPRLIIIFVWQRSPACVKVYVDADHAGCPRTRKSTTGEVVKFGMHNLGEASMTQSLPALSSGESEFYAIVKGVVTGLYFFHLLSWLGYTLTATEVCSDSSAGRALAARFGTGRRVKHLETQMLFVQHAVANGKIVLRKQRGQEQPADAGTKYLNEQLMDKAMKMASCKLVGVAALVSQFLGADATGMEKYADTAVGEHENENNDYYKIYTV